MLKGKITPPAVKNRFYGILWGNTGKLTPPVPLGKNFVGRDGQLLEKNEQFLTPPTLLKKKSVGD